MKSALLCAKNARLIEDLQEGLAQKDYAVTLSNSPEEALHNLKDGPKDAFIAETRRDAFAFLLQTSHGMHPDMPVHLIDGRQVFCFYPLGRQPAELVDAILASGVKISEHLLRHAMMMSTSDSKQPTFIV